MLSRMDPKGAARGHGPSGQVAFSDASAYADALATTVTSGELQPGDQLAGYEIEAVLGHGGMGVVYRAFDARLGRPVALKLIAPERAQDSRFRERFLVESQLAASLDHSNVVPVYDAGEADGRLYIAMRYVEGTDLGTLLAREAPLDPERALALVGQVAAALDAAHARGLVHRDVKPANILVTEEIGREHCYLSDFGLTRGPDPGAGSSEPAHLSGTVAYTSPEQITGDLVTGRADVYSLACVLYECLSGDPPFAGRRSMAVLVAHVQEPPPPLPDSSGAGPGSLEGSRQGSIGSLRHRRRVRRGGGWRRWAERSSRLSSTSVLRWLAGRTTFGGYAKHGNGRRTRRGKWP